MYNMVEISRIIHLANENAMNRFMKLYEGVIKNVSRYEALTLITKPMADDGWFIIRNWAEEHGLLAN